MAAASDPAHSSRPDGRDPAGPGLPDFRHLGRWNPLPPIWLEGRVYFEYVRLIHDPVFRGVDVPPGRRRPVLLIPGFLAGDWTVRTPLDWLKRVGYRARVGGVALNITYSELVIKPLVDVLEELHQKTRARVSIVGHSRGGVLAKVISHRHPDLVEQVITLGSPLGDPFDLHPLTMASIRAAHIYNYFRYGHPASVEKRFMRDLAARPKVPTTSIYSRSDGVISWKACRRADVSSIEVHGSHVGLTVNAEVYRVLGHVLSAPPRAL